jgi:hypothetical protein
MIRERLSFYGVRAKEQDIALPVFISLADLAMNGMANPFEPTESELMEFQAAARELRVDVPWERAAILARTVAAANVGAPVKHKSVPGVYCSRCDPDQEVWAEVDGATLIFHCRLDGSHTTTR